MPTQRPSILKSTLLNNRWLFAPIVIPMCVAVFVSMTSADLTGALGVSSMIQFSVRFAVPWLFIAFAASSLVVASPAANRTS